MKVIPQTRYSHYISYLRFYFYFTMSVPDEGYSTNTSFALHCISSFLFLFYYERTWWRLFHKHVIRFTLYIFISIFILIWAYLMKAITQTRHLHYMSSFLFLFYYERTWWRLFHKHVIRFTLYIYISIFILIWAYLMKAIPQTRHSHYIICLRSYFYFTMNVPDEGYSTNMSFALHYLSSVLFLFYYESTWWWLFHKHVLHYIISSLLFLFNYERTWWRLFHKHVIHTTLDIFVSICILLWTYLMKVIPQTCHSHYISYLRFYLYSTMNVPDAGYSTNMSFTLH